MLTSKLRYGFWVAGGHNSPTWHQTVTSPKDFFSIEKATHKVLYLESICTFPFFPPKSRHFSYSGGTVGSWDQEKTFCQSGRRRTRGWGKVGWLESGFLFGSIHFMYKLYAANFKCAELCYYWVISSLRPVMQPCWSCTDNLGVTSIADEFSSFFLFQQFSLTHLAIQSFQLQNPNPDFLVAWHFLELSHWHFLWFLTKSLQLVSLSLLERMVPRLKEF